MVSTRRAIICYRYLQQWCGRWRYSSAALDSIANDLGGALITSYGPAADAIGVGTVSGSTVHTSGSDDLPPLSWEALERDLLLAACHTDTIYVYSLEGCVEHGLLPRLNAMNWDAGGHPVAWKRALVSAARALMLIWLLLARFSRGLFAWLGWGLFALLLAHRLRTASQRR